MQPERKLVLITGAGSGIGRALSVEAAQRGMTVALCGRRQDALDSVIGITDHDLAGQARRAHANRIRIAADRADVI